MDDRRVREFETSLWLGGEDVYRDRVSPECVMVLPEPPFAMSGEEAIEAVASTPRWSEVELSALRISRPQEGMIVIAYEARAARGEQSYRAWCTSTYRRLEHERWEVVQHQQSPLPLSR
jgi:hypothetical protein